MAPKDISSLLPQLLSFPPHPPPPIPPSDTAYDRDIRTLRKVLNEIPTNSLTSSVPNGGDLLEILDPSINTLPYLYTLLAHIHAGKQKAMVPGSPSWIKALEFLDHFDSVQVRYVGTEFRRLVCCLRDAALASKMPIAAVRPIRTAILRLDPSASCLTSTHLIFLRLCLEARTFRAAKAVLDKDIYEFPSSANTQSGDQLPCSSHDASSGFISDKTELSDKVTYRDALKYFLYGAMIYMALHEWDRAIHFLEIILTAPSRNNSSQMQIEAYKKWPGSLPKTTSPQVAKYVRILGKPYEALGIVFKDGLDKDLDVRRLNAELHAGNQKWSADCNLGLVLQVLDAYRRFSIVKLGSTYAALPLPQVSQRTSPTPDDYMETAEYITLMINKGQLNATLDNRSRDSEPQSWVLRFATSSSTGPRILSEQQQYEEMVRQAATSSALAEHIRATDRKFMLSKEYAEWIKRSKNDADNSGNGGDGITFPGQHPFDDEDIMGDG
ncbi:MAG: hypothetical protein Q9181_007504 [Wetmoreana brouardii]